MVDTGNNCIKLNSQPDLYFLLLCKFLSMYSYYFKYAIIFLAKIIYIGLQFHGGRVSHSPMVFGW